MSLLFQVYLGIFRENHLIVFKSIMRGLFLLIVELNPFPFLGVNSLLLLSFPLMSVIYFIVVFPPLFLLFTNFIKSLFFLFSCHLFIASTVLCHECLSFYRLQTCLNLFHLPPIPFHFIPQKNSECLCIRCCWVT